MNNLTQNPSAILDGNSLTMSSREIAELVEKRHDNVKRTVETLAERGLVSFTQIEENPGTQGGRPGTAYLVNKRDSYVIVAQLSPEFTARLVDRWQELEEAARQQPTATIHFLIPKTLPEALRLAADLAEKNEVLEAKIEADAPKVEFHDKVAVAINGQTIEEIAKVLGTGRNRMFRWLREHKLFKPDNLPYQEYVDRGHFRLVEKQYNDKHGESHTYVQTLVTGKGFAFIQNRFSAEAA